MNGFDHERFSCAILPKNCAGCSIDSLCIFLYCSSEVRCGLPGCLSRNPEGTSIARSFIRCSFSKCFSGIVYAFRFSLTLASAACFCCLLLLPAYSCYTLRARANRKVAPMNDPQSPQLRQTVPFIIPSASANVPATAVQSGVAACPAHAAHAAHAPGLRPPAAAPQNTGHPHMPAVFFCSSLRRCPSGHHRGSWKSRPGPAWRSRTSENGGGRGAE